jgi:leader peptidase (prepilin peptidase)/N-methyltransferase
MDWIILFSTHPLVLAIFTVLLGAVIGSFLNVVIYRYPIMLKREWRAECRTLLNQSSPEHTPTFNLFFPQSHCTHCKHKLPFWLNIPILTYLVIGGQCAFCHEKIALRYWLTEIITAFLTLIVFLQYGLTTQTLVLWFLTWGLIALSLIDIENYFLPDTITYSLLWLGLLASTQHLFISPNEAIKGALLGYLFLYVIAKGYLLLRKKEGMGLGDCKMLAMIGAFVGTFSLPYVILLSTLLALITSITLMIFKKMNYSTLIPFGPFIAIGGWITIFNAPLLSKAILWLH